VQDHGGEGGAPPKKYRLVVLAASAGGLSALGKVLARLQRDFPVPVAIVQHVDPKRASSLASILGRKTVLHVQQAADCDSMSGGHVYVAPPGLHMVIEPGNAIHLTDSAPVHFVKPAADLLFESAARSSGPVIAVVLTGNGSDGAAGAAVVRSAGGVVIAQDEATSEFFGMPHAAIVSGVDYVLPLEEIGPALIDLTGGQPS